MGLKKECVFRRLQVALMLQQKVVTENRDKRAINRANRRVRYYVYLLDRLNETSDAPYFIDGNDL
jgi:hypothetical protein